MATLKIFKNNNHQKIEAEINAFMKGNNVTACPIQAISEMDGGEYDTMFYAYAWYKPRLVDTIKKHPPKI